MPDVVNVEAPKSPVKAIRAKCLDCSGGSSTEADRCPIKDCPLYPFRKGHNPRIQKREQTEEQRQANLERLAKAREKQRKDKEGA